jgi:hypothetical protein
MVDDDSDVTVTLKMALEDSGSFEVDHADNNSTATSLGNPFFVEKVG